MKKEYYDSSHDDTPDAKAAHNWTYQIAYDRKQTIYVVYDVASQIVATGICVPSATAAFEAKYWEKEAENAIPYM